MDPALLIGQPHKETTFYLVSDDFGRFWSVLRRGFGVRARVTRGRLGVSTHPQSDPVRAS